MWLLSVDIAHIGMWQNNTSIHSQRLWALDWWKIGFANFKTVWCVGFFLFFVQRSNFFLVFETKLRFFVGISYNREITPVLIVFEELWIDFHFVFWQLCWIHPVIDGLLETFSTPSAFWNLICEKMSFGSETLCCHWSKMLLKSIFNRKSSLCLEF